MQANDHSLVDPIRPHERDIVRSTFPRDPTQPIDTRCSIAHPWIRILLRLRTRVLAGGEWCTAISCVVAVILSRLV
jgi:hypothetical protein